MEQYYLNEKDYGEGIPSITTYYDGGKHPGVVDRYFKRFYMPKKSADGDNEDHLVLNHSNRICLIGLAPSHIAFKKGIVEINFNIGNCDRSQNQVKGKGKKGNL